MTNDLAVAEGLEPSMTGLTVRRFTNLATPQFVICALAFVTLSKFGRGVRPACLLELHGPKQSDILLG